MYFLTEQQIAYILNDIRRNGIEIEDLQYNLLDHICCILEQNLEENDDFESFYHKTIQQFYRNDLREIEEETINLLTFKNYYAMKKIMVASGSISVITFIIGSVFKIMHWPGAGVLFLFAIGLFSFLFLPLLCILKLRETTTMRNKLILLLGTISGILYSLSALFTVMHWPGGRVMWFATLLISILIVIPTYFFTGIRRPETKVNTTVATILLIALLGVQFLLTALRPGTQGEMYTYIQNEQLLQKMQSSVVNMETEGTEEYRLITDIQNTCNELKAYILQKSIGREDIPLDFEARNILVKKDGLGSDFYDSHGKGYNLIRSLKAKVVQYNSFKMHNGNTIPIDRTILDSDFFAREFCSNLFVLNNITQLQLRLATAEQQLLASIN